MAFNERYKDMADPITRLALFLHPGYRLVGTQDKEFEALQLAAGELAKKRDYGSGKVRNIWKNMEQYRANHEPFEHGFKQGETPEMWLQLVASRLPVEADGSPATITLIARMLSIVPHAAAPEQAFLHMGRTHSDLRNRFKEGTVSMMASINQYFTVQPPAEEWFKPRERPAKQIRSSDIADTGILNIQSTSYYKAWNPELPQQQLQQQQQQQQSPLQDQPLLEDDTHEEVEQTPDELDDSLRSMYEDCNTDWTSSPCQEELDIALHYDITDKLWDGEYVTLEADAAVAPIGNDEDAADMDLQQMLAWQ
ncbi:TPA: hypothetical protein ACH3X1_014569 [Trebouxia sp. C0004]